MHPSHLILHYNAVTVDLKKKLSYNEHLCLAFMTFRILTTLTVSGQLVSKQRRRHQKLSTF